MRKPNLLIIGAQKAGTTWIYQNLKNHQDVFFPHKKELEFFSRASADENTFQQYLAEHFAEATDQKVIGEATPAYFWTHSDHSKYFNRVDGFNLCTPEIVKRLLGNHVKLIVSLREPISRAVSAYFHHFNRGRVRTDDSILRKGRYNGIIDIGFYGRHLKRWLEVFDISNFCIVFLEDIRRHSQIILDSLTSFLEISPIEAYTKIFHKGLRRKYQNGNIILDQPPKAAGLKTSTPALLEGHVMIKFKELKKLYKIYRRDVHQLQKIVPRVKDVWPEYFTYKRFAASKFSDMSDVYLSLSGKSV